MPHAPLLWPSVKSPTSEVDAIKDLYLHLIGIEYSLQAWEAALHLYKTGRKPPASIARQTGRLWCFIAARECAMELFHLRARLLKIRSVLLRKCPTVQKLVDVKQLRGASKLLDECFPDIELLRHSIAHKGENEVHPETHAPDGRYALTHMTDDGLFSSPYEGTVRKLHVSDSSFEQIQEVVALYFSAFSVAAEVLLIEGHIE